MSGLKIAFITIITLLLIAAIIVIITVLTGDTTAPTAPTAPTSTPEREKTKYIRIEGSGQPGGYLEIAEIYVYVKGMPGYPMSSSNWRIAASPGFQGSSPYAVNDGHDIGNFPNIWHSESSVDPWIEVELNTPVDLWVVKIKGRTDYRSNRLQGAKLITYNSDREQLDLRILRSDVVQELMY